jgi:hypothetical protein
LILLYAVLAGLIAGWLRAWVHQGHMVFPELHWLRLVPLAFAPQWFAFYWSPTSELLPTPVVSIILVGSQCFFLLFAWANRHYRAFWWLGLGLLLNLLVIMLNRGLMPISPETLSQLLPNTSVEDWTVGQRFGSSKDLILTVDLTRLAWLSDRFLLPDWMPQRAAFSFGDGLIAIGAFWFLWQAGDVHKGALASARSQ